MHRSARRYRVWESSTACQWVFPPVGQICRTGLPTKTLLRRCTRPHPVKKNRWLGLYYDRDLLPPSMKPVMFQLFLTISERRSSVPLLGSTVTYNIVPRVLGCQAPSPSLRALRSYIWASSSRVGRLRFSRWAGRYVSLQNFVQSIPRFVGGPRSGCSVFSFDCTVARSFLRFRSGVGSEVYIREIRYLVASWTGIGGMLPLVFSRSFRTGAGIT